MKPPTRWAEGWLGFYWVMTALLLLFGPAAENASRQLAALQLVAALVLPLYLQASRSWRWGRIAYYVPWLPLVVWTYKNTAMVQRSLSLPTWDSSLQAMEISWWGYLPAMEWSQRFPNFWFSEFLHLCYVSYFLMVFPLILHLEFSGQREKCPWALGGALLSLLATYMVNIFVPALGPRPLLPLLDEGLRGPCWMMVQNMVREGAAAAAAFPSGHTSLSVALLVLGFTWHRKAWPLYLLWAGGTILATVYGRFHYVLDVMAGLALGLASVGLTLWQARKNP